MRRNLKKELKNLYSSVPAPDPDRLEAFLTRGLLLPSLLGNQKLSKEQIDNLRHMVSELQTQEENK